MPRNLHCILTCLLCWRFSVNSVILQSIQGTWVAVDFVVSQGQAPQHNAFLFSRHKSESAECGEAADYSAAIFVCLCYSFLCLNSTVNCKYLFYCCSSAAWSANQYVILNYFFIFWFLRLLHLKKRRENSVRTDSSWIDLEAKGKQRPNLLRDITEFWP